MAEVPVRPAATVILWRNEPAGPSVLMGMRGAQAVFVPSKYVFPGGGVDHSDHAEGHLTTECRDRLLLNPLPGSPAPEALAACALRELSEETGLTLAPLATLLFFFRAITPAGAPRRFDARFFLADAGQVRGDLDDFGAATDELSHLHLPSITEIVLAEVAAFLAGHPRSGVPFFDNSGPVPEFRRLL
jgi:8-oxo-dGTP pyrophosphatase MutT (NUDIX family)